MATIIFNDFELAKANFGIESELDPSICTMDNFISLLNEVVTNNLDLDNDIPYSGVSGLICSMACDLLISNEGRPVHNRIHTLNELGFRTRPGERDSFGWLTGIIHVGDQRVLFG